MHAAASISNWGIVRAFGLGPTMPTRGMTAIDEAAAPLSEAWYYAIPSRRLRRGRMLRKLMLGAPILIGRDAAGAAFALRDLCPHRGMPLSAGRFDTHARCTEIPSLVPSQTFTADRIHTRSYPVQEVQGNIWVFFGVNPA